MIPMRSLLYSGLVLLLCPWAYAAEHVTLSSGFAIDCTHHRAVGDPIGSQVRLYTSAGDSNYIDVAAGSITKIEIVPDPPKLWWLRRTLSCYSGYASAHAAVPVTMSEQELQPTIAAALEQSIVSTRICSTPSSRPRAPATSPRSRGLGRRA